MWQRPDRIPPPAWPGAARGILCRATVAAAVLWLCPTSAWAANTATVSGGVGLPVLGALLCGYVASTKNRNPWGWALFGFFCCPVALVCVLLAGSGDYR